MPAYGDSRCRGTNRLQQQLLEIWNKAKTKERDALLWGDEVEYLVVTYDNDDPRSLLSLRQADILDALANDAVLAAKGGCTEEQAESTDGVGSKSK